LQVAGVPHNFKCGNLNFGLEHSNAEYVVMMDADMILHHSFLRTLLPYIVDSPNIAFLQIPQFYYNLPLGDPLSDASTIGYFKVLPHRDSKGWATCIGTGALFRRKPLDAIGGFQPQSITEDTTTAYALFNQGYRSVYLSEKLQIGLSPWSLEGFIKQRCRWGKGAMQQFAATSKDMLGRDSKLSFMLKIFYFWHTAYYFMSFVNVILVATLLSALVFNLTLTVGSEDENRELIMTLALTVIFYRVYWFVLWLQVPNSV
jgi:cellulose synthase/poly-beta-1,6-N-acetylglucosamine synthase-like glycosyltransferase